MENIFLRCAGLDVHKASVEACVRRMEPSGHAHQQTRHWGTMTRDIRIPAAATVERTDSTGGPNRGAGGQNRGADALFRAAD
jgi:hypothetical protein